MASNSPLSQASMGETHSVHDLGKYRLIAELARGGMGIVFLAMARGPAGFNKLLVVKELRAQFAEEPDAVLMFLDEARLAARLNHPHIVQTFEVGSEGDRHFIAMEYLEGETLHRMVKAAQRDGKPLPLGVKVRILLDALSGLHHAHELRDYDGTPLHVVHRDVSPQNIFVTQDGQVKVVDFGIAKAGDSSSNTRTGVIKGKIAYMAPEQARGSAVDRRTDLFAVGVMLWEMVTGKRMWEGLNDNAILHHLAMSMTPEPPALQGVEAQVLAVACKATAASPADRYQSAEEFQLALEELMPALGSPTPRDVSRRVTELFAARRAEIKGLIEAHLRQLDATRTGEFQAIDMLRLDATSSSMARSATPISTLSAPARSQLSSSRQIVLSSDTSPLSTPPPPDAPASGRRVPAALVAALVAAAFAGGLLLVRSQPPPVPPVASASTASGAREEPAQVGLTVRASPLVAAVFFDGQRSSGNPAHHLVPRGSVVIVRVEAPGFTSRAEQLRAERDTLLDISLERQEEAEASAPAASKNLRDTRVAGKGILVPTNKVPEPSEARAPEVEPPTIRTDKGAKPKRNVDRNDPYQQ